MNDPTPVSISNGDGRGYPCQGGYLRIPFSGSHSPTGGFRPDPWRPATNRTNSRKNARNIRTNSGENLWSSGVKPTPGSTDANRRCTAAAKNRDESREVLTIIHDPAGFYGPVLMLPVFTTEKWVRVLGNGGIYGGLYDGNRLFREPC